MLKFKNTVEFVVKDGKTGEITFVSKDNAISDDFLCTQGRIYQNLSLASGLHNQPVCFLLRDDGMSETAWAAWTTATGGTLPRMDPWAPYCYSLNNSTDPTADTLYKTKGTSTPGYTPPSLTTGFRYKLFYQWTQLPVDLQLKAIGLTDMQPEIYGEYPFGVVGNGNPAIFVPQTLVVLPQSITVHGRNGGTTTPDILEITYFLSVVGAT